MNVWKTIAVAVLGIWMCAIMDAQEKWSLTPRPPSVTGVKEPVMSLNGTWLFSPGKNGETHNIEVPGEWAMQGYTVPVNDSGINERTFEIPSDWSGKCVILRFDAVHVECAIYPNGRMAGGHKGGFVPFEIDVTSLARTGENRLRVEVSSDNFSDQLSTISQYAAHPVGGIITAPKVTVWSCVVGHTICRLPTSCRVPSETFAQSRRRRCHRVPSPEDPLN